MRLGARIIALVKRVPLPRTNLQFALCLFAMFALIAGVGLGSWWYNHLPSSSFARYERTLLTKKQFNYWMAVIARIDAPNDAKRATATVPDAPKFTKCILVKRAEQPAPVKQKGKKTPPQPTRAALRSQCQSDYQRIREETGRFLIEALWFMNQARAKQVFPTDKEVKAEIKAVATRQYRGQRGLKRYLALTGMGQAEYMFRTRVEMLPARLQRWWRNHAAKPKRSDVEAYYRENRDKYGQPKQWDIALVLAKTKPEALRARRALLRGVSLKRVAARWSIDPSAKTGGIVTGVRKGQLERQLENAVVKAKLGVFTGPIKTQFGWYVFRVVKITPARYTPLAKVYKQAKASVASQMQQDAQAKGEQKLREQERAKTFCAKDYLTADCKNGPPLPPAGSQSGPPGSAPVSAP